MKLLYFAWVREKTGIGEEEVAMPDGVATARDLVHWLRTRGAGFAHAFGDDKLVRVAVNQEYATLNEPVKEGDEVAFFPPVTGG
ncbi:MAG: molybdopterin converting factor subunit 1 [Rhodospirillaceae bacterium]